MSQLRILADDLTGALDTAAAFSGEVPVFIDRPPGPDAEHWHAAVSAVATPTRDIPTDTLPEYLAPTVDWLRSGFLPYKKVDSLLRGNTFAEIAWLLRHGGFRGAIFAPAFPAQGRFTHANRQWIAKPGQEAVAVATPLREAFAAFGIRATTTEEALGGEAGIWMPEVRSDADLDRIAERCNEAQARDYLWCGSAGLAQAIARHQGLAPTAANAPLAAGTRGLTILISASFQPVLYEQWRILKGSMPTTTMAESARPEEITRAIELACHGADQAWFDLSPRREMTQDEALALLRRNIDTLTQGLPTPGQLLVVGGDTLLGVCRATGAHALIANASVRPGWGCATLLGGRWDGTRCHSRSGAFGEPDDLLQMLRMLTGTR